MPRPSKRLAQFENPFGLVMPAALGDMIGVQVALDSHLRVALGEGEQPTHGAKVIAVTVVQGQGRAVDEVRAPFPLDVRTAVDHGVGPRVGVAAEPKGSGPRVLGQVALESPRVRLAVDEVEIRGALRTAVGK